jgi:hypothetical protein
MTAPAEVLDIVGVVLGEDPVELDKPARALALAAMNALGYGTSYMGEVLGIADTAVNRVASTLGVKLDRKRELVDQLAVEFIEQGTPMKVTGRTLDAAILALHRRGKNCAQISRLTRTIDTAISKRARRLGISLADDSVAACWWAHHFEAGPRGQKTRVTPSE